MPKQQRSTGVPVRLFISYAREDEPLLRELEKHLSPLQQEGVISPWYNRQILAGTDWAKAINTHLETASLILLLISADFLASDYCIGIEMKQALERHNAKEAHVIPILLRPVDWESAPFAHLQYLPDNARPVTQWENRDEALVNVAKGIREVVGQSHASVMRASSRFRLPSFAFKGGNRQRLLERVQANWITGLLEHSSYHTDPIELEVRSLPNVLPNTWGDTVQEMPQLSLQSTDILEVYDKSNGELVLLGEAGSGKSTLLLELTRALLDHARHDNTYPIPVVFNLSSWVTKRSALGDWLIEELHTKYFVPREVGRSWVTNDQILPLLDGLDEVDRDHRASCIKTINVYHREHGLTPMVVCCRDTDYLDQKERLQLGHTVIIQSLTQQQIDEYLSSRGEQVEGVIAALRQDAELRKITTTPLMLTTLALAYENLPVEELASLGKTESLPSQIFAQYVESMLHRRGISRKYAHEQTRRSLAWLACQMQQCNLAEFYLERMQPEWLPTEQWLRRYEGFALYAGCHSRYAASWRQVVRRLKYR